MVDSVLVQIVKLLDQISTKLSTIAHGLTQISDKLGLIFNELAAFHYDVCTWLAMLFFAFVILGVLRLIKDYLDLFFRIKQYYDTLELKLRLLRHTRQERAEETTEITV